MRFSRTTTPSKHPWTPPETNEFIQRSVKALAAGNASDEQQKRALDFIIYILCGTYDLPFRPGGLDGDRESSFASGKMFVGQQLVKMVGAPINNKNQGV